MSVRDVSPPCDNSAGIGVVPVLPLFHKQTLTMRRTIVGLDIGGANLKASNGLDRSLSRPFAVWRHPDQLAAALADLLAEFPRPGGIAVTMTAELADCYRTKEEGVARILDAVTEASEGQELFIWQTGGEFVTVDEALELTPLVAAANWHALATWAARSLTEGTGLLIDIGSTTADIIPLAPGIPLPNGRTDTERLLSGELVYSGVRRTPHLFTGSNAPGRRPALSCCCRTVRDHSRCLPAAR